MTKIVFLVFGFLISNVFAVTQSFKLQVGDLLFQDLNCGVLCDGIGQVTYGINNTYISHVGMVISTANDQSVIIEANDKGVVETPLTTFLARSHDANNHPIVIVERLKPQYQYLIPKAITYAKKQLGKPYNSSFVPNNEQSFYCSELIYKAFTNANQQPIFSLNRMNFADLHTGKITKAWIAYFKEIKATPPQGQIGTNPGMLSRESDLIVVYKYGNLRIHH